MKFLLLVLCMIVSLNAAAINHYDAEFPDMSYLKWDDPIWYSNDGETWYTANFVYYAETAFCVTPPKVEGEFPKATACDKTKRSVGLVWYEPKQHDPDMAIKYVLPYDPATLQAPTKTELYGLLTRFENLMKSGDTGSAFSTATEIVRDREDLLRRTEALRKLLNETEYP